MDGVRIERLISDCHAVQLFRPVGRLTSVANTLAV